MPGSPAEPEKRSPAGPPKDPDYPPGRAGRARSVYSDGRRPGPVLPCDVLFACVRNAGRSQMAEAFARRHMPGVRAASAGTAPARALDPAVVSAMAEVGIGMEGQAPKKLSGQMLRGSGVFVGMGCTGPECPAAAGARRIDWSIPDPAGRPMAEVRRIRDAVEAGVVELARTVRPDSS